MDLRRVFEDAKAMSTETILHELNGLEDAPWGDMRGKPLDSRGLAMRLKKYGVASKVVRIGTSTPRGYAREDLHDVWERYLPSHSHASATCSTNETRTVGPAGYACATSATGETGTTCLRCDGEGCRYCKDPSGQCV
jgi:hypothetical protein